jgi:hypothetical protein
VSNFKTNPNDPMLKLAVCAIAVDGAQALSKVATEKPDIYVDGYDLAHHRWLESNSPDQGKSRN